MCEWVGICSWEDSVRRLPTRLRIPPNRPQTVYNDLLRCMRALRAAVVVTISEVPDSTDTHRVPKDA